MVGTREDKVIAAEDVEGSVEEFGEVNLNQLLQGKVYVPIQILSIYAFTRFACLTLHSLPHHPEDILQY